MTEKGKALENAETPANIEDTEPTVADPEDIPEPTPEDVEVKGEDEVKEEEKIEEEHVVVPVI
jgi:hypothetical protein